MPSACQSTNFRCGRVSRPCHSGDRRSPHCIQGKIVETLWRPFGRKSGSVGDRPHREGERRRFPRRSALAKAGEPGPRQSMRLAGTLALPRCVCIKLDALMTLWRHFLAISYRSETMGTENCSRHLQNGTGPAFRRAP